MTLEEYRKKYKNVKPEEEKADTAKSGTLDRYREKYGTNTSNTFKSNAGTLLSSFQKDYEAFATSAYESSKNMGYSTSKDAWENHFSSAEKLKTKASDLKLYLASNKGLMDEAEYNELWDYLVNAENSISKTANYFTQNKQFYSNWETEDQYNFWDERNTTEKRQKKYEDNLKRIEELKAELDATTQQYYDANTAYRQQQQTQPNTYHRNGYTWTGTTGEAPTANTYHRNGYTWTDGASQEMVDTDKRRKEIEDEIAALETDNRNYERGNYNEFGQHYGSKVVDDYSATTELEDFLEMSFNRNFGDATQQDYDKYYYQNYGGTMRDETGAIVEEKAGSVGYYDPEFEKRTIVDPLGFYFQTLDTMEGGTVKYDANIASPKAYDQIVVDGYRGSWQELTEEEINIYYYYLNKYGHDAAMKYLSDMETELNRRETMSDQERWLESYNSGGFWWKAAMNAGTVVSKFFDQPLAFADDAVHTLKGEDINPYSKAHTGINYSSTVRGATAKDLDELTGNFKVPVVNFGLGDLYQTGMSRIDSALATAVFGGGGTVFLGMGAATEEAQRLYEQGASAEQVTTGALAAGAAEAIFEYLSYGKLKELDNVDTAGKWVKSKLIQGFNEMEEEALTEISNILSNAIVMGNQSDLAELYKENKEDAWKTFKDLAQQVMNSAFGGFLSGSVAGGIQGGKSYIGNRIANTKAGKTILSSEGGVDALKAFANEVAGVSTGKTQKDLTKQIGKVDKNATAKNVGKLYRSSVTADNIANSSKTQSYVAKVVQRSGYSAEVANNIAEALVAQYNGQDITKEQEKLIKSVSKNQEVMNAVNGIMQSEGKAVGQRIQEFHKDVNTGIIAKETGISKDVVKALQEGDFETALKMVGGNVTTETETAPEVSYEVSVDGKTINAKGDEITIVGIDSVGKGKLTLKLSDGSTIDASEVSYSSAGEAMIYAAVANMDATIDADTAFKLVKAYDPASGISAEVYAKGLNQAYTYGFYNYNRSSMTAENALSAVLTEEQRNFAYDAGREYAEKHNEGNEAGIKDAYATAKSILRNQEKNGQTVNKSGEVIFEDGLTKEQIAKSKNGRQKNVAYLVAQKVSAKMGNDIHLYKGAKEFGFRAKSGDIWLNVNATADAQSMMLFTLSHELVHNARVYGPKAFKAFADFLVEQYGEHGKSVHDMVLAKQADYASQGKKLSYDKAYEEVVCDACERMLLDSNALEKLQLLEQKHPGIIERIIESIRNFLKHIREVFADVDPYADESKFVKEMESEAQAVLNRLFENMMVDSGKHYSTIKAAFGKGTVVETNADGEFTIAKSDDGSEMLYNLATWEKGGKETLQAALEAEGFSDEDIKAAMTIMDAKYDLVKKLGNEFNEQDRINQATITTDIKDGHSVLSALVSNGDYPVNIDLLMVCKKRKAYQRVINKLCETGMIQQATVDALAIAEINKILGKYGFETACLGCFVESRRLRIQEWANTIVKEWNSEVKKRNPNAKAFGFGKGEANLTQDEVMQLIGELESGGEKNEQGNLNLGRGSAVKRMGVLLDKVPSLRKTLSVEDLITPDGLTALRKFDSNLFSMVKSRYGSNSPKFVQEFNPYNHELAKYGKVPSEYKSLREYLYAIGGARMQSFSDFIVENWFDYCQIVADLAAKKLPMHTYTKEIALAKLFGLTGIKINMSLIPDIDRSLGKEFAGLTRNANGELELIWADKDRFKATGGKSYMQSINFADAIALQNDPRYSANVGTIAVGVSDKHILMMLDDNRIRMIIPYHSSGMNPIFADLMGTSFYKDYTMFQNTTVKQLYNSKGEPVSMKLEKEQTNKLTSGFQFNAVLQELGDARAAAQAYKDWCADASKHSITIKGETYTAELTPKFDSFSWHDNYYKLLEDFNTYDCISEEAAQQGDVQQIYPEDFDGILRAELTAQDKYRQKQEENQSFDKAMGEIESYLSTHSKADTVYYAEQNGIKLSDKDKKLNADEKRKLKALRDADMKLAKGEQDTSQEMDADRITIGMSDTERTAILQKKSLVAEVYEGQAEEAIKHNKADLESGKMGLVKSALVKIGEEFRIFIDYDIADVDVKIRLSRGNIKESVSKEITPTQIVKLLPVLKTAVENAVGIESHVNRYFFDDSTVFFENLLGGYVDGDYFVPVRFGLKHSTTGEATLYVIVDQQPVESKKIKAEVVKIPGTQNVLPAISRSAYKVSIANLAEFVNGKDLLRYLPDDMLSGEQKKAKWEAIAETVKKTNTKNDAKYTEFLASGNLRAAQNMVKQAAKVAGYTIEAWHGSRHIFDKFSKNKLGSNSHTKASHSWFFAGDKETANSYYPYGVMKELARQSPNIWKDSDAENMRYKGKLYALYLKMENPLIVDVAGYDYAAHAESKDAFMEYVEQAERNGNDGIILFHVRDNQLRPSAEESTVYMFREPSQAKLADTITYDEQDNVVPISERFNEERDELSYKLPNTLRDAQTAATREALEKQNEKLREDVSYLKELLNLQRSVTGGKKITRSSVEVVATALKNEFGATGNSLELARYLNQFYSFIAESDELTWDSIEEKAQNAVAWLREHGNVENDSFKELSDQELLRKVYDGYWGVSTLHTVADVKQKEINKLKAEHRKRMQAMKESHDKTIAHLKQQQKQRIEDLREFYHKSTDRKLDAAKERYQEQRQRIIENREKTAVRHKIKNVVKELNQLLLNEDKKRHVPDSLKKAVADALSLVNMDTVGAEERAAKYAELIANETDPDKIDAYTVTMENILRQGEKMGQRLKELRDAYEEIQNSDDPDIANAYDPVIAGALKELAGSIGNTSLRDMSIDQLQDVYSMYKMVLTRVRDANKTFIKGRTETISNLASRVVGEVKKVGGEHKYRVAFLDFVKKFGWDNMKPVYAFEHIGSGTLTDVFNSVRTGEDTWAKDVTDARAYYTDKSKKYGYDSWDFKKKYSFNSASGLEFELTLEQILSLYAYSKREQAHDHLRLGGFVFDSNIETYKDKGSKLIKYKVNTADAHQITPDILADITGTLTKEQTAFVDEMQEYLSTVMGAKGNEVTMQMYGVKLFKEKFYFPLKSAKQFMFEQNEVSGEVRIKNSGFTNKVVAKANNPVILNNFMDVWANHVNDMSMYHAFVLPLEDFNRVFNYNSPKQEGRPPVSVKGTIQNAYGPAAVGYVRQLITDLNGGAVSDPRETFAKAMVSKFKKAKVFSSLSVVIQQPSAIGRAFALVNPKYFRPTKDGMSHDQLWEELKQYAPVAVIKEMGYFDTNMGRSTTDFIKAKEYSGFKEKAKAVFKDSDYRDEKLSRLPALADEVTWCAIWNAVKRETISKHHDLSPKSEAFLKIAGERFTEVITKTQVYDSVLSRSANMRSKSGLMSMVTSFMAEPTTTINMIEDAILKAKRGDKVYAAKAVASVMASIILNNALVALVYGARDDDDDETYLEKYLESFVSNMVDDVNPITYYPYLKDIWSLFQGYDVERADVSLFGDLADSAKALIQAYISDDGDVGNAWLDITGTVANLFGVPMDNIRREVNGAINLFDTLSNGQATTWRSLGDNIVESIKDAIPVWGWLPDDTKADKLYDAIISGDTTYANRLKSGYKDQNAINNAIRKGLRENDPRIRKAAIAWNANDLDEYMRIAKEIIAEKHFVQDDVVMAIRAEANALATDAETETKSKVNGLFTAEKFAEAIAQGDHAMANAIKVDIIQTEQKNGKTAEEAEKSFKSSATSELKDLFLSGALSESKAIKALETYCGKTESEATADVQYWIFKRDYPDVYADDQWFDTYYEKVADSGISINVYMDYRNKVSSITGEGKKEKRMAVINSLPITSAQKDALYYAEGWTASKLYEAPWH